jgi:hypothetical protein
MTMSDDDPNGTTGGMAGGPTGGWSSVPDLDDTLAGFAEEVRVGRPAGALTEELLGSLTPADQSELLVMLTRRELLRRAGQDPH